MFGKVDTMETYQRARKLAKARKAQEEDEARDKKGKWPRMT